MPETARKRERERTRRASPRGGKPRVVGARGLPSCGGVAERLVRVVLVVVLRSSHQHQHQHQHHLHRARVRSLGVHLRRISIGISPTRCFASPATERSLRCLLGATALEWSQQPAFVGVGSEPAQPSISHPYLACFVGGDRAPNPRIETPCRSATTKTTTIASTTSLAMRTRMATRGATPRMPSRHNNSSNPLRLRPRRPRPPRALHLSLMTTLLRPRPRPL